jgi:hypothetical protein
MDTPGEPRPPPGETWRDLVDVEGMSESDAAVVIAAAEEALRQQVEPGLRRARFVEGYVAGYRAATAHFAAHDLEDDARRSEGIAETDSLLRRARELVEKES